MGASRQESIEARAAEIGEAVELGREEAEAHEVARDAAREQSDQTRADVDAIRIERRGRLS
jgi:CHASE3 domain sensor protein